MKNQFIYIVLFCLLTFGACQEPQVTLPSVYDCEMTFEDDTQAHPHAAAFQAELDKVTELLPGMQASIFSADGIWSGASGMADIPNQVAMEPCHKLMVGSISKVFTGVMILQLQEEGILSVEDKLSDWLDQSLIGTIENANDVTLRQLLNHTTGIKEYLDADNHVDAVNIPFYQLTQTEKMELIQGKNARFAPGEKYEYSNSNYVLLGLVIEKARNMPLWDVVRIHITEPAGMSNTVMGTHDMPIPTGTARPYLSTGGYKYFDIMQNSVADAATGDGGIASNMQDLIIFMNALFSNTLMSQESFDQMQTLTVTFNDGNAQYGLGLETFETDNWGTIIGHGGSTSSYSSFFFHFPEYEGTLAFSTNCRYDKNEVNDAVNTMRNNILEIAFK